MPRRLVDKRRGLYYNKEKYIFFGAGCNSPPAVQSAKESALSLNRCNSDTDGKVRTGKEHGVLRPFFRIKIPKKTSGFFMRCSMENERQYTPNDAQTTGAGTSKRGITQRFAPKRLAVMAIFVALAFVVSFLEIPLFPSAPFLKLDFGNVFILLIAFLLGPVEGIVVCLLKEGLRIFGSSSGGVGELANMLVTCTYILLPALVYRFHKGLKVVIPTLAVACILGTGMALFANRFINFPLYVGAGAVELFTKLFWVIVAFNLIKTAAVSALTVLLYKRLSNFLKKLKI